MPFFEKMFVYCFSKSEFYFSNSCVHLSQFNFYFKHRLGKGKLVIVDVNTWLYRLFGNRHTQHVEWVKRDWNGFADRTLHFWFQLSVKKINENGLVSLFESVPELCSQNSISFSFSIFVLDVGFLADWVDIFVHCFKQDRQHFLRVVLGKPLKLNCLPCNPTFDIPRINMFTVP